jgi:hypothetical protein
LKIDVAEYTAALKGEEELQKFCAPARDEMLKSDVIGLVEALSSLLPPVDKEALLQSDEFGLVKRSKLVLTAGLTTVWPSSSRGALK